jgi:RNA polymerase primary sigma factor
MMSTLEDTFEAYLHNLHDLPLLDAAEEQRLFAAIEAGRAAAVQVEQEPAIARDECAALEQQVKWGEQARETVITAHLRLVIRIARQYTSRGVSLLDLIQEGNLGLLQAIDRFDPNVGVRFATYAAWWIRHAIADAIAGSLHPVRLPADVRSRAYRLYRARNELQQQLGREPGDQELAAAAGLSVRYVRELLSYLQPVLSLNAPFGDDADQEIADIVPDPQAELMLSQPLQRVVANELEELLRHLTDEERSVLTLRFGLCDHSLHTRRDVAQVLGISNERVRQIEARALRKLRAHEFLERLDAYTDH